jgi:L-cysteine:1D-myo-inositol 2-amino-2-deoxy-alpha-D-glucopyranoside ligase
MNLYNTLAEIEPFQPRMRDRGIRVRHYPYDTTHLGHAFTYTTFDLLIRYLELQGRR